MQIYDAMNCQDILSLNVSVIFEDSFKSVCDELLMLLKAQITKPDKTISVIGFNYQTFLSTTYALVTVEGGF